MTNYRLNDLEPESAVMKNLGEQTQRKRKRYLEVLSITCTTIGINMAVACFCGVPDSLGFKSPEVFLNCTFAFLLASVFLGIMAMISCIKGYEFLQTSFVPSLKHSLLFPLLNSVHSPGINIQKSSNTNAEAGKKQLPTAEISEVFEKSQIASKFLDNSSSLKPRENGFPEGYVKESYFNSLNSTREGIILRSTSNECCKEVNAVSDAGTSRIHSNHLIKTSVTNSNRRRSPIYSGNSLLFREYGVSAKPQGHRFTSSPRNNKQLKAKNVLQLKKRQNTILFGQVFAADSSGSVRGPINFSCEVERNNKTERLNKFLEKSFANKVKVVEEQFANQSHPREIAVNKTPTGTIYGAENACFRGYNSQDRLLKFSKKCQMPLRDKVSDVALKLNEMNFLS